MNELFSQGGKGSTGILTNKQAIARKFGVKQNEVVYFAVGVDLGGYKVIYDKTTQRAYSLPVLPVGTTGLILSEQAVLVHSAGTVDLGELAATRREFVNLSDSFTAGLVVNTRNETLLHNGIAYTYLGNLPVTITPETSPVGNADWKPQTDPNLREDLAGIGGSSLVYLPSYNDLRSYSGPATYLYVRGRSTGTTLAGGWFSVSPGDATTPDDDGTVLVDALNRRWSRVFNGVLLPEWFGADPSGTSDCTSAFNKCFASAKGKEVKLGGKYKFLSPIVVDYEDQYSLTVSGTGSSNHKSGAKTDNYCYLDFDDIPENSRALTFKGVRGLILKDFHISHRKVSSSVSMALWITQLDNFKIDGVTIDSNAGSAGQGIRFGESGGEDCAFMGSVDNCKIWMHGGGPAISVQPLCTSITFKNCYQIGGYYYFQGCIYTSMITCASEGSEVNGYGYVLYAVKGFTAINCAGEANKNGVFYISNGSSNVEILSPFGAGNNSGNTAIPGALVYVDGSGGFNANIHIDNPVSENQGSNTVNDIGFSSSNKNMSVTNVYAENLLKGIGGDSSWAASNLSLSGDLSQREFTFTIPGWTVTSPVMSGKYIRSGKRVDFTLTVSGNSLSTSLGSSFIQLPFGTLSAQTVCSVASSTGNSFGSAVIDSTGKIFVPTTSGASGIIISGSILTL